MLETATIVALAATGLKIAWHGGAYLPDWIITSLNYLTITGQIHQQHITLGWIAVGLMATHVAVGLFASHSKMTRPKRPNLLWSRITLASAVVCVGSGVILYSFSTIAPGLFFLLSLLHSYSTLALLAFGIAWLMSFVFRGRKPIVAETQAVDSSRLSRYLSWSLGMAILILALLTYYRSNQPIKIVCREINRTINIDGRAREIEWTGANEAKLSLHGGANFPFRSTEVTLRTFHNRAFVYFLISWTDDTPSLERFLEKTDQGWKIVRSEDADTEGENVFWEDQLSLMFSPLDESCQSSCHIGASRIAGSHFFGKDTSDVWTWRAISTNPVGMADDGWCGPWYDIDSGGMHLDNSAGIGYRSNLNEDWSQPYFVPLRRSYQRWIDLRSNRIVPYFSDEDVLKVGTRIPAVMVGPSRGDRADVIARGRWRKGRWTVEIARAKSTGSPSDVNLRGELNLGIAMFDNSQKQHAYHLRQIRLVVE